MWEVVFPLVVGFTVADGIVDELIVTGAGSSPELSNAFEIPIPVELLILEPDAEETGVPCCDTSSEAEDEEDITDGCRKLIPLSLLADKEPAIGERGVRLPVLPSALKLNSKEGTLSGCVDDVSIV